ncbi:hypothetical protein F5883DRAFT_540531 [Diaporthe sp. PMI_573]|nr:hypothetical protein F5883DRAFT_540531 [Diaporthaceae sp. PMI_573]
MLSGSDQASMTVPSSRRSACDRCRGQKLGCSREGNDPSGRCDRCAKADAKCLTTPIYHMRHYTFADHDTDGRSTKSISTTTSSGTMAMSSLKRRRHHKDDRDARDQSKGQQGQGKTPLQGEPQVETTPGRTFAEQPQARPSASPVGFTPAFATFEWPSLDAFGKPDQGAGARSRSHVSSPGWSPIMEIVTGSVQPSHPHRGSPPRPQTLVPPEWDTSGFAMSDYLAGDLTNKNGTGEDAQLSGLPWPQTVQEGDMLEQSPLVDPDLWGLGLPSSTISTEETHYRRMEDLSRVNLELATQLRRLVNSPPDGTLRKLIVVERERPGAAPTATTPLLGDILNSTRGYLDILAAVTDSRSLPDQSPGAFHDMLHAAHAPPLASNHRMATSSNSSSSSSSSSSSRMSTSSASSPDLAASTPPSSMSSAPKPPPDPSMISLALICYVHILRLHVAVFTHIRQYLEHVADTNHGRMTPISGFCGFDECHLQSGNLQTTMFIQMVTNSFERMERLLGLPREFHIGTRGGGGTGGLLNAHGFVRVAGSMLRKEEAGRPEEGQGGIQYLRKAIKKAKRLLRDRIAP